MKTTSQIGNAKTHIGSMLIVSLGVHASAASLLGHRNIQHTVRYTESVRTL
jgi:hypothetical protein